MANAFVPNSEFMTSQALFNTKIKEQWPNYKIELDKLIEPILWIENSSKLIEVLNILKDEYEFDFLSDITAYDNEDEQDGQQRFILVYQLYSITHKTRIRIKCPIDIDTQAHSIVGVWPAANWLEREVYDMFGITFLDHPKMERILMDKRFTGYPLRKEYPIKLRESFSDNVKINLPLNNLSTSKNLEQ